MIIIAKATLAIAQRSRILLAKAAHRISDHLLASSQELRLEAGAARSAAEAKAYKQRKAALDEAQSVYHRLIQQANTGYYNSLSLADARHALSIDKADSQVKASCTVGATAVKLDLKAQHLGNVLDQLQ